MPFDNQKDGEWAVFDTKARQPDPSKPGETLPRLHEARMGMAYPLRFDKPCYMPEGDARVFLKDPAFKVVDADGRHVASLDPAQMNRTAPAMLPAEMVVAHLNELTDEALLTRVAQISGGYRYTRAAPREVLIEALISGQTPADDGRTELLSDEIEGAALDKMLEGA